MKRMLAIAGFLSVALMGILCFEAEAQYPGVYGHHDLGHGYDSYGHNRYDGHGHHGYGHNGYGHAGYEHYGYEDGHAGYEHAGYGQAGQNRFGYGDHHHIDGMRNNNAYDHGHAACPFALGANHADATLWQHGDHSHGNSFADPHAHADGMQRRSNPGFATPNGPSENRDNTYIPQPSLSQNRPAPRGNASDPIVMDGPPPSLNGVTSSPSGESSPSHDHAGHDHAGHDHAH